ncbi:hypothetical protein FLAG1_01103 [Fusarium langsethiae]|uniref:Uncharacterized protein n=1 Tax=Fusarium langsethiae TaxID=179993 RepID=A0A0M9F4U8_FUSLA|nr:hypothetical protein FLAG1_01103 [Fusarium langsethiae]
MDTEDPNKPDTPDDQPAFDPTIFVKKDADQSGLGETKLRFDDSDPDFLIVYFGPQRVYLPLNTEEAPKAHPDNTGPVDLEALQQCIDNIEPLPNDIPDPWTPQPHESSNSNRVPKRRRQDSKEAESDAGAPNSKRLSTGSQETHMPDNPMPHLNQSAPAGSSHQPHTFPQNMFCLDESTAGFGRGVSSTQTIPMGNPHPEMNNVGNDPRFIGSSSMNQYSIGSVSHPMYGMPGPLQATQANHPPPITVNHGSHPHSFQINYGPNPSTVAATQANPHPVATNYSLYPSPVQVNYEPSHGNMVRPQGGFQEGLNPSMQQPLPHRTQTRPSMRCTRRRVNGQMPHGWQ